MARVWKHRVFLSDEDVQSIVSEAQETDTDTEQQFQKRATTWQAWEALIFFKLPSFLRFSQMKTLVNAYSISLPLAVLNDEDLNDEIEYIIRGRKRRRTESLLTTNSNPE
ncbi:unnamed protein product [Peronospora effusa]|uniref:Uncharacterized protein n=1 Tax=Peronospora effusa TaxID=542832 RepID=A0A3M6VW09_9STRA|nr:hypothetical protein DD238_001916 [Peronospora effusa]RQM18738.1 hypothetical protein DD237_000884 [Peronospora effusa]CAI5702289.1 unnamed protein product [Peronospora effusa]